MYLLKYLHCHLAHFASVHSHIKINFTMEKTRRGMLKISFMSNASTSGPHPSLQLHLINLTKASPIVSQRNRNIKLRPFDYCCNTSGIYTFKLPFGLEFREKNCLSDLQLNNCLEGSLIFIQVNHTYYSCV